MKIVVAMDSFKGCLSSPEAGQAAREGILRAGFGDEVLVRPLADGGRGHAGDAGAGARRPRGDGARLRPAGHSCGCTVCRPARRHGRHRDGPGRGPAARPARRARSASRHHVRRGELIRHAVRGGCRRFLLGLGGSATNDGGAGMLQALGFSLLDESGRPVARGAAGLRDLASLSAEGALPELRDCTFRAACDVTNPLCGPLGCSAVFGPQKARPPNRSARGTAGSRAMPPWPAAPSPARTRKPPARARPEGWALPSSPSSAARSSRARRCSCARRAWRTRCAAPGWRSPARAASTARRPWARRPPPLPRWRHRSPCGRGARGELCAGRAPVRRRARLLPHPA